MDLRRFQLKEEMRRSQIVDLARDLPPEVQGDASSEWIVVDAGSIFIHLMTDRKRGFLDLQTLWDEQGESADVDEGHVLTMTKDTITVDTETDTETY